MNNVFRGKFAEWGMIEALSPTELGYEIVLAMHAKLQQNRNIQHLKLDKDSLVAAIAEAHGDSLAHRIVIAAGVEAAMTLSLLVEAKPPNLVMGGPEIYLTKADMGITTPEAAKQHQLGSLQAYTLLDESILERVWSTFIRGDYDIAISYAFKRVEVEMREKGGYSTDYCGERLIKKFFTDFRLHNEPEEQPSAKLPSAAAFVIGTFDLYRNPATHVDNTIGDFRRALEVLLIANHQLHLVRSAIRKAPA